MINDNTAFDNNELEGKEKIIVFDTTLRDGEQASGFHMFPEEKLEIAKQLAKLGVDIIEAGFAASSPGDFEAIKTIAEKVGTKDGPIICSLARTIDSDIEAAGKSLEPAYKKRIHLFIGTSDIHIQGKFGKDRNWVIEQAVNSIKKAKHYTNDIEFSCEDFGRSDSDYIVDIVCEVIKAGATTINLPDTVGWLLPNEAYEKVSYVIKKIREKGFNAIFSVHNHNDFGMASATTIEEIRAGARQIEVTINGIGERAGNTSLEEVIAILKTRKIAETNINTKLIGETSRLVSKYTGIEPSPNKSVVGKNAFAHEAGIHQSGIIKDSKTYEIMDPVDFGVESIITFGPRSGRRALKAKYESLGIKLNDDDFEKAAKTFFSIADKLKEIDDADIVRAINNGEEIPKHYKLISYHPVINEILKVTIELKIDNEIKTSYAEGNGQVDAAINAIKSLVQNNYELIDFKVVSKGKGSDAMGFTQLKLQKNGWKVIGRSENTDSVKSAIEAYIDACNRLKYLENFLNKSF
ncbi:MAG: 2-isopropylmalate synthase [Nanoarchaeota archaeon]|nr:2-isopropylmalate synthase [Nanoarchaeota archaeon]